MMVLVSVDSCGRDARSGLQGLGNLQDVAAQTTSLARDFLRMTRKACRSSAAPTNGFRHHQVNFDFCQHTVDVAVDDPRTDSFPRRK